MTHCCFLIAILITFVFCCCFLNDHKVLAGGCISCSNAGDGSGDNDPSSSSGRKSGRKSAKDNLPPRMFSVADGPNMRDVIESARKSSFSTPSHEQFQQFRAAAEAAGNGKKTDRKNKQKVQRKNRQISGTKLEFEGHLYQKKEARGDNIYWRCDQYKTLNCTGTAKTIGLREGTAYLYDSN
ncbi:hypothetical protein niasHT_024905 [Heterodera trifolii]|uniref:FLYWCH-type domain-containing protein n=1 Tax=Heterodera trifolii TaxID=157864 RepID=A0ABD2JYK5_9BILA